MTYADTITLLLCLFVVILSVTAARKDAVGKLANLPAIEQSIRSDDTIDADLPFHDFVRTNQPPVDAADEAIAGPADDPAAVPLEALPITVRMPASASAPFVVERPGLIGTASTEGHSLYFPEIVDRLKSQGQAAIEQQGDHITTLEIGSTAFFGSGSATLSTAGRAILRDVTVNLKSEELKGYQVTVEGHTDDTPISTSQFPSNWELSTARASAVVHFLLDQGVAAQRLNAAGYADTFPVVPNRNADGSANPENQARNRRVVIKLEKIDAANRVGVVGLSDR